MRRLRLLPIFERILTVILAGGIFGGFGLHPQVRLQPAPSERI
jgi:hypothetical protein